MKFGVLVLVRQKTFSGLILSSIDYPEEEGVLSGSGSKDLPYFLESTCKFSKGVPFIWRFFLVNQG